MSNSIYLHENLFHSKNMFTFVGIVRNEWEFFQSRWIHFFVFRCHVHTSCTWKGNRRRMSLQNAKENQPSNCNFDRVTLTVERNRSTYWTARKSVSSFSLYSSATSISQSIRIVRIAELISDWWFMKLISIQMKSRSLENRITDQILTWSIEIFHCF